MRHRIRGRKLGRKSQHRVATLRNLATALFTHERITTTLMKAKEMRPFAEKLITRSRLDTLSARRLVARDIRDKGALKKLFETLAPRYAERPGGYTRLYHLGHRPGDASDIAMVELVGMETVPKKDSGTGANEASESSEAAVGEGRAPDDEGKK